MLFRSLPVSCWVFCALVMMVMKAITAVNKIFLISSFLICYSSLPDDFHLPVLSQTDDAAGLVGLMLLSAAPADIVHLLYQFRCDVAIVLSSGLSADIGGGRYQRFRNR